MLPVLFSIGDTPIYSFGVFVALGFVAGMWWCKREAIRRGLPVIQVLDLTFWLMIFGLLGARLGFVLVNWQDYTAHPADLYKIWEGGLVWYGGFLLAFAAGVLLLRYFKLPFWPTADLVCTALPLGHAIGRLGCLAAGDDHGRLIISALGTKAQTLHQQGLLFTASGRVSRLGIETIQSEGFTTPWYGLVLGPESLVQTDLIGLPIYATQVYMFTYKMAIFAFLAWFRRWQQFDGQVVALYLLLYPTCRFVLEFFRGDLGRGFWLSGLSTSQGISLVLFACGLGLYAVLKKRAQKQTALANV